MSRGFSSLRLSGPWVLAAALAPCATFAYDWHDKINLDYDSGCRPTLGYDVILEQAAGEMKNETTRGCAFFAQFAEFLAAKETGTVWDGSKATQPLYEGTALPRSLRMTTANGKTWVHANATEHMAEWACPALMDIRGGA